MKPCSTNRMNIGLLAIGDLPSPDERTLRAHIESCEGCRDFLKEISNVTKKLTASASAASDIQASEVFHQKLVQRLKAQEPAPGWERLWIFVRITGLNWRVALPAMSAIVLALAVVLAGMRRPPVSPAIQTLASSGVVPASKINVDPTIFNYEMAAGRSLEKFDELLTRQENRNASSAPLYTVSALSRVEAAD